MKIKITTDRQPWANGQPHDRDAEVEVTDEDGAALIDAGFAVAIAASKKATPAAPVAAPVEAPVAEAVPVAHETAEAAPAAAGEADAAPRRRRVEAI